MPGNAEPGESIDLADQAFDLTISEPVEFAIYVSSTRLTDRPGEIVEVDRRTDETAATDSHRAADATAQ